MLVKTTEQTFSNFLTLGKSKFSQKKFYNIDYCSGQILSIIISFKKLSAMMACSRQISPLVCAAIIRLYKVIITGFSGFPHQHFGISDTFTAEREKM